MGHARLSGQTLSVIVHRPIERTLRDAGNIASQVRPAVSGGFRRCQIPAGDDTRGGGQVKERCTECSKTQKRHGGKSKAMKWRITRDCVNKERMWFSKDYFPCRNI